MRALAALLVAFVLVSAPSEEPTRFATLRIPELVEASGLAASPSLGFSPPARHVFYAALAWQYLALLTGTLADYFHANERMALSARSQLAAGLALNVATLLFLALGGGLTGYCAAYVLGGAVGFGTALLGLRGMPWPRLRLRWGFVRELAAAAAPFMLLAVVGTISARLDVWIVTRATGEAGAGLYGAAFGLIQRLIVVPDGIATSLYPALAAASAGESTPAEGLLRRYLVWMGMVTLPIALAVSLLAPAIVAVLYGPRFAGAAPLLAMAIWLLPLAGVQMLAATALNAAHLQRITVRSSLLANAVVLTGLLLLTPRWGLIGAVTAILAREAVATTICAGAAIRRFPGCLDRKALPAAAIVWAITATLASLARMLPPGWEVVGIAAVMGLVYPGLLWRAGLLPGRRRLRGRTP